MKQCAFATALQLTGITDDGSASRDMAKILADAGQLIGKTTINSHRKGACSCSAAAPGVQEKFSAGGVDDQPTEYKMMSDEPWGYDDFCNFLRSKGQDPDTVTFSWGVTSSPTGGYWNKINNVKAKDPSLAQMVDYDTLAAQVRSFSVSPAAPGTAPATYVVGLADWQLGKGEGDGTPGTIARINASLSRIVKDVKMLQAQGRLPDTLLLANMGDHIENVYSSYANQAYTTDMNVRDQINLAIETNLNWIRTLAPYFKNVTYAACLCNHGQLSRNGGKTNVSDDADNATGLIGDMLKTLCALHDGLSHVEFIVPRDEMITLVETSGVSIAMAHGHKISGAEETWLAKQSQNLVHRRKFIVDLWFTAHKHHASLVDLGPYTRIQATTSDPGSKYFEDMTGQYSRPGTTVFIASSEFNGCWDHYQVL